VAVSCLLLLNGNFNIIEKKKVDYQVLWLAFFAFYNDKINSICTGIVANKYQDYSNED
jgi:arabinogalactan endo-1,4-beta-galactosidase